MQKIILALENISIGYNEKKILSNLNLSLKEKSIVALMGKNGSGKSCLLKTISALIPLKSGSILLLDKNIANYSAIELAKTVSVVLTEAVQVEFLKVHELIALGRSPYLNNSGSLAKADIEALDKIIRLMNIEDLRQKFFSELSDGQKQKVLIARALAQEPQLLILDEPTTFLDIPSRKDLMNTLRKIVSDQNISILYSSHDAELACEFADLAWLIDSKGAMKETTPQEVKKIFSKLE
jgi:iron complex transport system ATP-binding protein